MDTFSVPRNTIYLVSWCTSVCVKLDKWMNTKATQNYISQLLWAVSSIIS